MKKIVEKLNNLVYKSVLENQKDNDSIKNLRFACGNFSSDLYTYITSLVPSGKVCFLHTKNSFDRFGAKITSLFETCTIKSINIVCDQDFSDNLSCYSKLFNIGDDVRIVVSCDYSLYNGALYLASTKKINCILLVENFQVKNPLTPFVCVENNNKMDKVYVNCSRHVYLINNLDCFNDLANCYAYVLSHLTTLIDYRIWQIYSSEKLNKNAYQLLKESVKSAYCLMDNKFSKQSRVLLTCYFQLELANLLSKGVLNENSASISVAYLYQDSNCQNSKIALLGMLALLQIYELFLSNREKNSFQLPDLIERASLLSRLCSLDKDKALKNLLNQSKLIKDSNANCESVLKNLLVEISSLVGCVDCIKHTFISLGGNVSVDKTKLNKSIKLSGDITPYVNGMSLVREYGLLEYID